MFVGYINKEASKKEIEEVCFTLTVHVRSIFKYICRHPKHKLPWCHFHVNARIQGDLIFEMHLDPPPDLLGWLGI